MREIKNRELSVNDFISNYSVEKPSGGEVEWISPSNLAVVKYWGKYGTQLPRNPSISITLSEAVTQTNIRFTTDPQIKNLEINFLFEGEANTAFENRIKKFLSSIASYFPFLTSSVLNIESKNSFPHSSGIASSASSMSALALCLCDIERNLSPESLSSDHSFFQKASFISRLGSGSACRSVYPHFSIWGETEHDDKASNLYALGIKEFHPSFKGICNDIFIVDAKEKEVSSSAGHELMERNPYAQIRYNIANENIETLQHVLQTGEVWKFGEILEAEALSLHALMMVSEPSYTLMRPNTLKMIEVIRSFRNNNKIPVFFSLDAGPNIHLISYDEDRKELQPLLDELLSYTENGVVLNDKIGEGPEKVK